MSKLNYAANFTNRRIIQEQRKDYLNIEKKTLSRWW